MPYRVEGNITMENVRIVNRNFRGLQGPMNALGDRNFCVLLEDPELIRQLTEDGWNVKYFNKREDSDVPQAFLPVKISFKNKPPMVYLVTNRGKTRLTEEDDLDNLDHVDIMNVDVIIKPYNWEMPDPRTKQVFTGVKAYAVSLYITVYEDELSMKYADISMLPTRSGRVDEG